ncbi:hypothetical protein [Mesorhizobium sp. M0968]|uniref:hypothetical protein n=1 Tax=Mesorhizobium sp. M0968 TaxID=2957037 RepID=UPI003337591C
MTKPIHINLQAGTDDELDNYAKGGSRRGNRIKSAQSLEVREAVSQAPAHDCQEVMCECS